MLHWEPETPRCGTQPPNRISATHAPPRPLRSSDASLLVVPRVGLHTELVSRPFISRQHTDARYSYSNSVRPSVRPFIRRLSVRNAPVLDENGLTYRHSFSPYYWISTIQDG